MADRSTHRWRHPKKERANVADACTRSAPATTARSWRIPRTSFERLVMFELRMVFFLRCALLERNVYRAVDAHVGVAPRDRTGQGGRRPPQPVRSRGISRVTPFHARVKPRTGPPTHPRGGRKMRRGDATLGPTECVDTLSVVRFAKKPKNRKFLGHHHLAARTIPWMRTVMRDAP
jgi:hypothetical protein